MTPQYFKQTLSRLLIMGNILVLKIIKRRLSYRKTRLLSLVNMFNNLDSSSQQRDKIKRMQSTRRVKKLSRWLPQIKTFSRRSLMRQKPMTRAHTQKKSAKDMYTCLTKPHLLELLNNSLNGPILWAKMDSKSHLLLFACHHNLSWNLASLNAIKIVRSMWMIFSSKGSENKRCLRV